MKRQWKYEITKTIFNFLFFLYIRTFVGWFGWFFSPPTNHYFLFFLFFNSFGLSYFSSVSLPDFLFNSFGFSTVRRRFLFYSLVSLCVLCIFLLNVWFLLAVVVVSSHFNYFCVFLRLHSLLKFWWWCVYAALTFIKIVFSVSTRVEFSSSSSPFAIQPRVRFSFSCCIKS